jgi:RNA polymerase sigma-70 factor (ECF subfamily)
MEHPNTNRTEEFVELSSRHQRQLLGYLFTLVRNMDDAEDLLQQTNLVVWRKFDDYQAGTDFMRWACHIAHLQAIAFLRSKGREPVGLNESLMSKLADTRVDRSSVYERYREGLRLCMERLTSADRELLELCYDGDSSIKEIAKDLGRSADSIYHSLKRIRYVLLECINRASSREEHPA